MSVPLNGGFRQRDTGDLGPEGGDTPAYLHKGRDLGFILEYLLYFHLIRHPALVIHASFQVSSACKVSTSSCKDLVCLVVCLAWLCIL